MTNDATTAPTYDIFGNDLSAERVWDPAKVVMVIDHYLPCNSVASAEYHRRMRRMAAEQQLAHVYEGEGICHQVMMESHVRPARRTDPRDRLAHVQLRRPGRAGRRDGVHRHRRQLA